MNITKNAMDLNTKPKEKLLAKTNNIDYLDKSNRKFFARIWRFEVF